MQGIDRGQLARLYDESGGWYISTSDVVYSDDSLRSIARSNVRAEAPPLDRNSSIVKPDYSYCVDVHGKYFENYYYNEPPLENLIVCTGLNTNFDNIATISGHIYSYSNRAKDGEFKMILDSGSSINLISKKLWDRRKVYWKERGFCSEIIKTNPKNVQSVSNEITVIDESIELMICIEEKSYKIVFQIMEMPADFIIGWSDIVANGLVGELIRASEDKLTQEELCLEEENELKWSMLAKGLRERVEEVENDLEKELQSAVGNCKFKETILKVLREFIIVFDPILPEGGALVPPMKLECIEGKQLPTKAFIRRQNPEVQKFIDEQIDEWIRLGFIVESTSQVVSAILVAMAPNHKWRCCVNYQKVNDCIQTNLYPLPNLKEILSRLFGKRFFCKLDLRSGYLQCNLHENSRYLSAFSCAKGFFEFKRIPFGLKPAVAYFQYMMKEIVLNGLVGRCCEVYVDDVVIYGQTIEELIRNTSCVLSRFKGRDIRLNLPKCQFGLESIEFLGYVVNSDGISLSEKKLQGIRDMHIPNDVVALKSLLGLINHYREFIPNLATTAKPMYELTSDKKNFHWTPECTLAFNNIKQALMKPIMLHHINYDLPLVLRTDASNVGVGGVLFNVQWIRGELRELIIAYVSHRFTGSSINWSTADKEGFAIYFCIMSLDYYLRGQEFLVQTDHSNLKYLMKNPEGKGRVARWSSRLADFNFAIKEIQGRYNIIADALSRCLKASILHNNEVINEDVDKIISSVHNAIDGHKGITLTIKELINQGYRWETLRRDVVEFIHKCGWCQKERQTERDNLNIEERVIEAYFPFEEVSIDTIVNVDEDSDGYKHVLVMIDSFSRFVEIYPCKDQSAATFMICLMNWIGRYGPMRSLRSDKAPQFKNKVLQQFEDHVGTNHIFTIGYHSQANGIVERANREVMRHLRAIVNEFKSSGESWNRVLPVVQRIMNTTVHTSIGCAPATLIFGLNSCLERKNLLEPEKGIVSNVEFVDRMHNHLMKAISASQRYLASVLDRKLNYQQQTVVNNNKKLKAGDYVLVTGHGYNPGHLQARSAGPYKVIEIRRGDFLVMDLLTKKEFLVNKVDINRFNALGLSELQMKQLASRDSNELVVKEVVSIKRSRNNRLKEMKLKLRFFDDSVQEVDYMSCHNLAIVQEYLESHNE